MINELIARLEDVETELVWRKMSMKHLEKNFVEPMIRLSEDSLGAVVQGISRNTFQLYCKKLWETQDMPEEQDGHNRTMNIVTVLKRTILMRLPVIEDAVERSHYTQQLAHCSLILNPILLERAMSVTLDEADDSSDEDTSNED